MVSMALYGTALTKHGKRLTDLQGRINNRLQHGECM